MEAKTQDERYDILAKLVLFFSKWDVAMIDWYLEMEYGSFKYDALKNACNATMEATKNERKGDWEKLYPEEESLPFLFRFLKNRNIKYDEFRCMYKNSESLEFLKWMDGEINSTYTSIYNIYLLGYMLEWATYSAYNIKTKSPDLLCDEIVEFLKKVENVVCSLSEKEKKDFYELRAADFIERFEFLYNEERNMEFLNFIWYERYVMLFKRDEKSDIGLSLDTVFRMLNDANRPKFERDSLLFRIKTSQIVKYFQDKYDKECISHQNYIPFDLKEGKSIWECIDYMFAEYPSLKSDRAKTYFTEFIKLGFIKIKSADKWEWTEYSDSDLAYLCGKIYFHDELRMKEQSVTGSQKKYAKQAREYITYIYKLNPNERKEKNITLQPEDISKDLMKLFGKKIMKKRSKMISEQKKGRHSNTIDDICRGLDNTNTT